MSILSWNCRGSGGDATILSLARYLHSSRACLAFISETKCSFSQATTRISRLPLRNAEIIPSVGKSGGIWLLWNDDAIVDVVERSHFFLFAKIKLNYANEPWLLGAIYGHPNPMVQNYIWDRVTHYASTQNLPLCIIGDFNCILGVEEKMGGSTKLKAKNKAFASMVHRAGLHDLGYSGPAYTWTNHQPKNTLIRQRLDRALANALWVTRFRHARVLHLPKFNSDHAPILLTLDAARKQVQKSFRVENWWLLHSDFAQVCSDASHSETDWNSFLKKLKTSARKWEKQRHSPQERCKELEDTMAQIQSNPASTSDQEREIQDEYNKALLALETYWAQRSRLKWAYYGDTNCKFYHIAATARKRRNLILSVKTGPDRWTESEDELRRAFVTYFKSIFCSLPLDPHPMWQLLPSDFITSFPSLPYEFSYMLNSQPMETEITGTLFSLSPDRAPGPDGI
ncbi:DNAse I-like superfamily protein [Rhynchospora pubera]|uniref:DNAse I-like superfamily protein n=1 Tax=Rhynchospora pubera TaxID=906938 RepID=A0AAV8CKB5_9POAL|nr:DNAse I-like superfamily protein [Rhynchospora pubera]